MAPRDRCRPSCVRLAGRPNCAPFSRASRIAKTTPRRIRAAKPRPWVAGDDLSQDRALIWGAAGSVNDRDSAHWRLPSAPFGLPPLGQGGCIDGCPCTVDRPSHREHAAVGPTDRGDEPRDDMSCRCSTLRGGAGAGAFTSRDAGSSVGDGAVREGAQYGKRWAAEARPLHRCVDSVPTGPGDGWRGQLL